MQVAPTVATLPRTQICCAPSQSLRRILPCPDSRHGTHSVVRQLIARTKSATTSSTPQPVHSIYRSPSAAARRSFSASQSRAYSRCPIGFTLLNRSPPLSANVPHNAVSGLSPVQIKAHLTQVIVSFWVSSLRLAAADDLRRLRALPMLTYKVFSSASRKIGGQSCYRAAILLVRHDWNTRRGETSSIHFVGAAHRYQSNHRRTSDARSSIKNRSLPPGTSLDCSVISLQANGHVGTCHGRWCGSLRPSCRGSQSQLSRR